MDRPIVSCEATRREISSRRGPKPPGPCTFLLFGATGDLARRKLYPALYRLAAAQLLPERFVILGLARTEQSALEFRRMVRDALAEHLGSAGVASGVWQRFEAALDYARLPSGDDQDYRQLARQLHGIERDRGTEANRMAYLATPPSAFGPILRSLARAELIHPSGGTPWTRVVIEKPFGRDLDSARQLNRGLAGVLDESQIYRIDHYLGKETVQNILVFRFGNAFLEPLLNRKYVDHVQITAAEPIGIGTRGRFYDKTGVVRDIVQNHLLQLVALTAMEAPLSFGADDIRDAKLHVLRSLRPICEQDVARCVVAGQYDGYRNERDVASDSNTPTYVAIQAMIDNWRWQGVPFYLRAGKSLGAKCTEIAIQLQSIPLCLFPSAEVCERIHPNVFTLRIQPDEGIRLSFATKVPGYETEIGEVTMDFSYERSFDEPLEDAYQRLLLDAMRGDPTLFDRQDAVEQAWRWVTPILQQLESSGQSPVIYAPESAGPRQADELLWRDGRAWRPLTNAALTAKKVSS
ncbi:MAG: glucose-6-phosphate dehydrogenase [Acidobacteriota bacterium]|nr:MAG: glucose-6-phosphate dehydrogenase [Acidobacteriota bacterium]